MTTCLASVWQGNARNPRFSTVISDFEPLPARNCEKEISFGTNTHYPRNLYSAFAMVRRKQMAEASAEAVPVPPLQQPSKIPNALRFPILVLMSMALSSALYAGASNFGTGDLATVMRRRDQWWEITGLLAWKAVELGIGWWGEYDGRCFCCLSNTIRGSKRLTDFQVGILHA